MTEVYIDIRDTQHQLEQSRGRFESDPRISPHNKAILLRFLRDAALGKTVIGRAKKRIGPARLHSYIIHLSTFMLHVGRDLDAVTQEDMERFIEALDAGRVRSRRYRTNGPEMTVCDDPLGPRYAVDLKVTIRKFYKWLLGDNKTYPPIVEWIDTSFQTPELSALTEREVERMVDLCRVLVYRAVIQVLFDGGFRLGELLNIRLRHVILKSFDPNDPEKSCFFVRVPFSKTLRRTVALPMRNTTKWLSLWIEKHPARPEILYDGTLRSFDLEAQLFPLTADAVRLMIGRLGRKSLGKRVYPHLLRHSSATFWSNRLSHYKLCKRFGWTMTSKMPQRYIDREGVDELESARVFIESERSSSALLQEPLSAVSIPELESLDEVQDEAPRGSDSGESESSILNRVGSFDRLRLRGSAPYSYASKR